MKASRERGRPARTMMASRERGRPARTKPGHSLGHLPHLDRPGTAPWLSFGLAAAVPAHRVAACSIALKLSGVQRDSMRAGRPRSQAMPSRRCRGGYPAGDFSECRPAPFGKLPFAREPCPRPPRRGGSFESDGWPIGSRDHVPLNRFAALGNIDRQDKQDKKLLHANPGFVSGKPRPRPPRRGGSFRGETASRFRFGNEDEPQMNTNRHEYGWSSFSDERRPNASALL